jgi:hypothetical protein
MENPSWVCNSKVHRRVTLEWRIRCELYKKLTAIIFLSITRKSHSEIEKGSFLGMYLLGSLRFNSKFSSVMSDWEGSVAESALWLEAHRNQSSTDHIRYQMGNMYLGMLVLLIAMLALHNTVSRG